MELSYVDGILSTGLCMVVDHNFESSGILISCQGARPLLYDLLGYSCDPYFIHRSILRGICGSFNLCEAGIRVENYCGSGRSDNVCMHGSVAVVSVDPRQVRKALITIVMMSIARHVEYACLLN